jgi:hypothetical protein
MKEQPEALRLFTHQLLDCDGQPNGVHIGCGDLAICKKAYVKGETSSAIHEWVDAAELRRLHAVNAELLGALQSIAECCDEDHAARDYASRQTEIRGIARAAIAKAEGEKT